LSIRGTCIVVFTCCAPWYSSGIARAFGGTLDDAKIIRNDGRGLFFCMTAPGLENPSGVAAASDASAYYVAGRGSDRVYVFDATGAFLFSFTGGGLTAPTGLDLTSDDGVLYVCSSATDDVKVFSGTGAFVSAFGSGQLDDPRDLAVTSDDAVVYVASRGTGDIRVFKTTGEFLFPITRPGGNLDPVGVVLTSNDAVLYVANAALGTIERFSADGAYLGSAGVPVAGARDVALTSDDGLVYVARMTPPGVDVLDAPGDSLLLGIPGGQVSAETHLTLALDDALFAVTNYRCHLPDFDCDGDVDLTDFVSFQLCYGGSNNPPAPSCPECVDANLDGDGDVDLADFLIFQQNFTGSR